MTKISPESFVRDESPLCGDSKTTVWEWRLNNEVVIIERERGLRRLAPKTPAQLFSVLFNPPSSVYWTAPVYSNKELAQKDADVFGGEVIDDPYGENLWFISFDDLDKAIHFIINFKQSLTSFK